jgi:hypothetical protein
MTAKTVLRRVSGVVAGGCGLVTGAYAAYAAAAWRRYGHAAAPGPDERDELLDRFMPRYEIVERHRIHVDAPAPITLAAAKEQDLLGSPLVRSIFKARELVLGATPDTRAQPRGLLAVVQSLGWGVLAEAPDREIVMGAVTKPWEANVTFRALPPDAFAAYKEPDYVKIAWTLRVDAVGANASIFRTETRAAATDPLARAKFRWYWAFASPGIAMIRWLSLGPLRREAERRTRAVAVAHGHFTVS